MSPPNGDPALEVSPKSTHISTTKQTQRVHLYVDSHIYVTIITKRKEAMNLSGNAWGTQKDL